MNNSACIMANRVLVVDDDEQLVNEYVLCLGEEFEPDFATATITDLEKVLFGQKSDKRSVAKFDVHSRNQGAAGVEAVKSAIEAGCPYAIVFLDVNMPPGIDGIEAARQIRALDPNINIVVVTGSISPVPENLEEVIPPADKLFFFQKPFHAVECRQLSAALCGKWHADTALRGANEKLEQRVEERTAALQKLAYFDIETGLPNQLSLLEELRLLIEKADENEGDTVVVLIDIERFSFINETMGYDAGTELLRSVDNRLSRTFCTENGQGKTIVGRFGADEFAVLVPGVKNDVELRALAEQIKDTVEEPFFVGGRDLFLKVDIGVSWHPVHGHDAGSVIRCAEAALHRSTHSLNRSITYYHSDMRYRARYKFDLEAALRSALENGDICADYQPQQCTVSGDLAGVEALARWTRPDGSTVPPSDFIPLSEEMGVSDLLFETIMRNVCSDVAVWREQVDWQIPVSVNLSAHQFRNQDLVSLIKGILQSDDIDQKYINLELTETVLLEDLTIARPVLNDLAAYGVGIHIDDFGTGYSSLSYLAQLPVNTIKIDQAFVSQLSDSNVNSRVIAAIVALGKAMRLEVVAEGVETEQQYAIIERLGCDLVQGHFIAKAMPADQFMTWVRGRGETNSIIEKSTVIDVDARH